LLKICWSLHPYRQRRPTGNFYNALNSIRIAKKSITLITNYVKGHKMQFWSIYYCT